MAFAILGHPIPQFLDSSGDPLSSGTITTVEPSTDVAKATYPTYDDAEAATNANDNPLTLNSRGEPASGFWGLDGEDYKITVKDSDGNTIYTIDDIFLPQYTTPETSHSVGVGTGELVAKTYVTTPLITVQAYTRTATVVVSRTLAANASASAGNNNSVLAALIADLQQKGIIQ